MIPEYLPFIAAVALVAAGLAIARLSKTWRPPLDPTRLYTPAQRAIITNRAGGRCEAFTFFGRRCREVDGLAADHIWPHTLGGWTSIDNAQALCTYHNSSKGGRAPTRAYIRRLQRRRRRYFPPDADPKVRRFQGGAR